MTTDDKIPAVLMHVRITSMYDVANLEAFRNDLQTFLDERADLWGLRIKRRKLTRDQFTRLFAVYQDRAFETVVKAAVRTPRRKT